VRRRAIVAAVSDRGEFLDLFNKQAIVNRLVNELHGAFGTAVHIAGDLIMGDYLPVLDSASIRSNASTGREAP
jgi:hypothetical protein